MADNTVFDVLKWFHEEVFYEKDKKTVRASAGGIIDAQREQILRVAREEYYCPEFECTQEDACRSFAIHGPFPHGTLHREGKKVPTYLPDFSIGVRCFGFFGRAPLADRGYSIDESGYSAPRWQPAFTTDDIVTSLWGQFPAVNYGDKLSFSTLEYHLCDSLETVYTNAKDFWERIKGTLEWTLPANDPEKNAGRSRAAPTMMIGSSWMPLSMVSWVTVRSDVTIMRCQV